MELKDSILNAVKHIYDIHDLDLFSNKGHNGLIFYYSNNRLIKVTSWNERAFGPCEHLTVEKKLEYINNLKSKGLLVPQVYPNPDGQLSTIITCENRPYIIYAMERIDTIPSPKTFNTDWGISLEKIHKSSTQENDFHDYQYEWINISGLCDDEEIRNIWDSLFEEISSFEKTEQNYGLLHGDPQPDNFLPTEKGMYTIDFDMMFNGYFAHDIAIGLQYVYADIKNYLQTELSLEERVRIFNQFMDGYSSVNNTDRSITSKIDTFLRYRRAMRLIGLYKVLQKDKDNFEVVREKVLKNERIL